MFLQGHLQAVFDALYSVGAIDPVLRADWSAMTREMEENPQVLGQAVAQINRCDGRHEELVRELQGMDPKSVHFLALEVAREFCEFQERGTLH